ncbi:NlpC/P60 family protein [Dactylosporangium sp. AC04546]|uniref:C40 family peptidase n=1 Tax=Dactylosporangium sp. AC04546 TaxID=2862460 RepID=UPI001EDD3048|nr:C40 family peptidase [Dactylosporangium sp. AC04546]WVK86768.1 NlpC/P60 family protein [Dactylosporangium sp. AC04546]
MSRTRCSRSTVGRLLVLASAVLVGLLPATTAHAEPSLPEVEKQLDEAWEKLEPVIEQYNNLHSQLLENQKKAAALTEKLKPLQLQVDAAMRQVGGIAAQQYKFGRPTALTVVLSPGSSQDMAERLVLLNRIAKANADQIAQVASLRDQYAADLQNVDALVKQQQAQDAELAAQKKTIQAEVDRLQALRNRLGGGSVPTSSLYIGACPAVYIGGAAGTAVKTACAQIGKPYVWGAGGPGSFDCSGLTQYAWKAAGVSLTHYTGAQWKQGTAVSKADLRPGDLVFFYSDLHHVGMYVGNGLMVHASRAGVPVRMARIDQMPYMGARRPG